MGSLSPLLSGSTWRLLTLRARAVKALASLLASSPSTSEPAPELGLAHRLSARDVGMLQSMLLPFAKQATAGGQAKPMEAAAVAFNVRVLDTRAREVLGVVCLLHSWGCREGCLCRG